MQAENRHIARAIRNAVRHSEDTYGYDKGAMREIAEALFHVRSEFTDPDGRADYTGRSWAYRQEFGEILSEADLTPEQKHKVTALLRYHMSQILRDRLSEEQLKEYGLQTAHSLDKQRERRRAQSRLTRVLRQEEQIIDGREFADALRGVQFLLSNVDIARMPKRDLTHVHSVLSRVERRVIELQTAISDIVK